MIRAALVLGAALVASSATAAGTLPPVSLAASPVHVHLRGAATQALQVTNRGATAIEVTVSRAGFTLDLRGRPKILTEHRAPWFSVTPRRIAVPAGGNATATISSTVPRGISPGDHTALVLLSARTTQHASVSVRMRIGVVVTLRVPGPIVHRLEVRSVRVHRSGRARLLAVTIDNRGNVTELLGRGSTVSLLRGRRVVARLHPARRQLLPAASALTEIRYAGAQRGWVTAQVELRPRASAAPSPRRFRVRL